MDNVRVIAQRLRLTPGQRDSLQALVDRHREALLPVQAEMGEIRDSAYTEIRSLLLPSQIRYFERMIVDPRDPLERLFRPRS